MHTIVTHWCMKFLHNRLRKRKIFLENEYSMIIDVWMVFCTSKS